MIANAAEVKRSKIFSNSRRGIVQIKRGGDHGYQIGGGREKLRGGRNLAWHVTSSLYIGTSGSRLLLFIPRTKSTKRVFKTRF
jgi:hypothetical protein